MENSKRVKSILYFSFFIFHFSLVHSQSGIIATIAGSDSTSLGDGGLATVANLDAPYGVTFDKYGNIYISDFYHMRVRKVSGATGIINTIIGNGRTGYTGDGGLATAAELGNPDGLTIDSVGNLYVTDNFYHVIRKVDTMGIINTVAGNGYQTYSGTGGWFSGDGGQATLAELNRPQTVCLDKSGNLYIADYFNNRIRMVTASTGIITTIAGNGYGTWVAPGSWTGAYAGDDGEATDAELYGPTGVAVDDSNNIIISDGHNNTIRKVNGSSGIITTIAGNGIAGYTGNGGSATAAELHIPVATLDAFGNIYIADGGNNVIRLITKSTGIIITIAGMRTGGFSGDGGLATDAELLPQMVMPDDSGNFYIADGGNNRIRKVTNDTVTITGLNKLRAKSEEVRVFPNPSNGVFNLYLSNVKESCNVEIFNYLGENIYSAKINSWNSEINIQNQPDGVYFYRVLKQDGSLVGEGKLIIER